MARGDPSVQSNETTTLYNTEWEEKMRCNGVLMDGAAYDQPQPLDLAQVLTFILQGLDSVLPLSEDAIKEWHRVKYDVRLAPNEPSVRQIMEPILLARGPSNARPDTQMAAEVYMCNLALLVPKVPRFSQPDSSDGALSSRVGRSVLAVLGAVIKPSSSQPQSPHAPNFFLEFKGPQGDLRVAMRQLLLDCAYGARGIHALETLAAPPLGRSGTGGRGRGAGQARGRGGSSSSCTTAHAPYFGPYGRCLAFGATYTEGILRLYAMHVHLCRPGQAYVAATADTPGPLREYHLVLLDSFDLMVTPERYYKGLAALRNLRELARQVRNDAIDAANARLAAPGSEAAFLPYKPSQQGDDAPPAAATSAAASGKPASSKGKGAAPQPAVAQAKSGKSTKPKGKAASMQPAAQASLTPSSSGKSAKPKRGKGVSAPRAAQASQNVAPSRGGTGSANRSDRSQATSGKRKRETEDEPRYGLRSRGQV
jgi:hypothetical protein